MYLKYAYVENSGSLRNLQVNLPFNADGRPKPLILVGGNGGGKTNFLSLVADSLFEAAAAHYDDVLPVSGQGRAWFRLVGSRTISVGAAGSVTLLQFEDEGVDRFFVEKAGSVVAEELKSRTPNVFHSRFGWENGPKSFKKFSITDEESEILFKKGVYTYFPSSRSEIPYWLNVNALPKVEFDLSLKISKKLKKPIFVERSIYDFTQWLLGVISDTRTEIYSTVNDGKTEWHFSGNPTNALITAPILNACNMLIGSILGEDDISFSWLGRKSSDKIAIAMSGKVILPSLSSLSTGQAVLLGIFGTILRYGDISNERFAFDPQEIVGICIIDEIDAHIHIDLQYNVLPKLIQMFPRVQFVLSSHSPIFVLGMERVFGSDGMYVIEMPSGMPVNAEAYDEFGKAVEAVASSSAFTKKVFEEVRSASKPIIFLEGETDGLYLKHASELLGRTIDFGKCDVEWIGSHDGKGRSFNTGKDAMQQAFSLLRANPSLINRRVLILKDNDVNSQDYTAENLWVRSIPKNLNNCKIEAGIENLLSEQAIQEIFFEEKYKKQPNGNYSRNWKLNKMKLCDYLLSNGRVEDFEGFSEALDIIEEFLAG
ncbi:AAA family ATPase [Novosphingobium subterraneum]|uniref:AAA family ATPase n=1 Tax=Novosphingobium subterraneum TaxID=48936 RepID=UPI003D04672B